MKFEFTNKSRVSTRNRTDEGFLDVSASIYRSGLFEFSPREFSEVPEALADKPRIVLNVPDEAIRDRGFLDSVVARPVTDGHPSEFVNVKTARYISRGTSKGPAVPEPAGDVVLANADLRIVDEDLVREIEEGGREEVSIGNTGEIEWAPGVRNGVPFDGVLDSIRVNHIAIVNRGRGGPSVRLHNETENPEMKTVIRILNGVETEISESSAEAVDGLLAEVENGKTELATARAEIENQKTEIETLKGKQVSEEDVARMVNERVETIETARRISRDLDVSGTTREIRVRAIRTVNADLVSDSSSDEVVAAVFATLAKVDRAGESVSAAAEIQNAIEAPVVEDQVAKARNERRERRRETFNKTNFGGK